MESAYVVLGIPGNASVADIERAFERARAAYPASSLADDPEAADKHAEILTAYKVLRDPESRAAHNRKLARQVAAPSPRPVATYAERETEGGGPKPLMIIAVLVAALFAGGFYVQHRRQAAQAELAAKALEIARQNAIAEEENRRAAEFEARDRARRDAQALYEERAFRRESDAVAARAQREMNRQESLGAQRLAAEQREERRKEQDRIADEQRRSHESQRRVAADRQRIRELCYINYRRYDC